MWTLHLQSMWVVSPSASSTQPNEFLLWPFSWLSKIGLVVVSCQSGYPTPRRTKRPTRLAGLCELLLSSLQHGAAPGKRAGSIMKRCNRQSTTQNLLAYSQSVLCLHRLAKLYLQLLLSDFVHIDGSKLVKYYSSPSPKLNNSIHCVGTVYNGRYLMQLNRTTWILKCYCP